MFVSAGGLAVYMAVLMGYTQCKVRHTGYSHCWRWKTVSLISSSREKCSPLLIDATINGGYRETYGSRTGSKTGCFLLSWNWPPFPHTALWHLPTGWIYPLGLHHGSAWQLWAPEAACGRRYCSALGRLISTAPPRAIVAQKSRYWGRELVPWHQRVPLMLLFHFN